MVTVNRVHMILLMGNTYANLDAIRATGATFDNGDRVWKLNVERHPMNNVKQKKKLEKMLTDLEERGVRMVYYYTDGVIKS